MLTIPGAEDLRLPIVEHIYPPYMITECPTSPLDAPVKAAAIEGLLGAFSQIWSYDFLTALIRSQEWENPFVSLAARECRDHTVVGKEAVLGCLTATATARFSPFRVDALNSLQVLGSAARPAVPELITLLEAANDNSPQYLSSALGRHSRKSCGNLICDDRPRFRHRCRPMARVVGGIAMTSKPVG